MYRNKRLLITTVIIAVAGWLLVALADDTRDWLFSTPGNYDVSNSEEIEVADGVAKLKLRAEERHDASLDTYLPNASNSQNLAMGTDVSVTLSKTGPAYNQDGIFTSRIFDGGLGNVWSTLRSTAYNTFLNNAAGEVGASAPGLVALYHLNNNYQDSVTGGYGSPRSSGFVSGAKLGSHAAYFLGDKSWMITVNSALLSGATECTITCWVKWLQSETGWKGFITSRGSTFNGFAKNHTDSRLLFYINTAGLPSVSSLPVGRWVYLAFTWSASDGIGHIYMDGIEDTSGFLTTSPIIQNAPFYLATDNEVRYYTPQILMDEVAFFNRQMTEEEIQIAYDSVGSLLFQVRADETPGAVVTNDFVGPDTTANSYYGSGEKELMSGGGFKNYGRYVQYKAYFAGQSDGTLTPYLDAIGIIGSRQSVFDNTLGDFIQGEFSLNTTNDPTQVDVPHLGSAKKPNGGYYEDGTYTSRVFDGGGNVFWDHLSWDVAEELDINDSTLIGLYHLNGGWADETGHGYNGVPTAIDYSPPVTPVDVKLGNASALFNGSTSIAQISLTNNPVRAIEFWIKTGSPDGGIMEFSSGAYITIQKGMITPVGFPDDAPTVYVNGSPTSRRLRPGWNHVAVSSSSAVSAGDLDLTVGRAQGDYFEGALDELALYTRAVAGGEFKAHYIAGGRGSGGRIRFQVRADSSNPPGTTFVGPGNSPSSYFTASAGSDLPSAVWQKRYFQYRAYLEGDGESSPAARSITVTYSGPSSGSFTDDTIEEVAQGDFGGGTSQWMGDEMAQFDRATVPGIVNLDPISATGLEGLWHMDEQEWSAGASVIDSSPSGLNGNPQNGANTAPTAKVGTRSGMFNGVNQFVILPSVTLNGDFTISAWFKSSDTTRSAVLSRSDGAYIIELNGNGNSADAGKLAFVVDNGAKRIALSAADNLNDGGWHNVTAVRHGSTIYVYVDGLRAGSRDLGIGYGGLGAGQCYVARHGPLSTYLDTYVDEVIVFSRALSDSEIRRQIGVGHETANVGTYLSDIYDASGPAIWEKIAWREDGPFDDALTPGNADLVGLWSLDFLTNGNQVVDSSGQGNNGTVSGATTNTQGRFDGCLSFDGAGDSVQILDALSLEPTELTVEAWVYMNAVDTRTVFDKRNAGSGYALATDVDGKPYLWVSGTMCKSFAGIRPEEWTHLAGTYDGSVLRLYVNGRIEAVASLGSATMSAGVGTIGQSYNGSGNDFDGLIDQVAIHNRALHAEEIADHARAGLGSLLFQARASNDPNLAGAVFVGPDGTSNTYFRVGAGSLMVGAVPLGQYFQFKAYLSAIDGELAPTLYGMTVNQSSYSTEKPWVIPGDGQGQAFFGNLSVFSHVLAENTDTSVRYQVSGDDGATWYWWNSGQWEDVSGLGWDYANYWYTINDHIGTFYKQLYDKVGGTFRFKAYLHSTGNDQVALDQVGMTYDEGRLTVTVPNGDERGDDAWLVGVPYTIQWTSAGTVSDNLLLEYSLDNGGAWTPIAGGVPDTGSYSYWTTPNTLTTQALVRITDLNDTTISDTSDRPFELTRHFRIIAPNGGETWYAGRTNIVRWASPTAVGGLINLFYAADGTNFPGTPNVAFGANNVEGVDTNRFTWVTPTDDPTLLSERGRMRIQTLGGAGRDDSDDGFTLAGIYISNPTTGSAVKRDGFFNVRWTSSGAGSAVALDYSANAGGSWSNVIGSITNVTGTNSYDWYVTQPPTDTAKIRLRSLSDPNVVGISKVFTLADVDILRPAPGEAWQIGRTNTIVWLSGGAGNKVNIYYSTNAGADFIEIEGDVDNVGGSNTYEWVVEPYPGPLSQIRVEAVIDPENLADETENFNIAGVRVQNPNGGETWVKDVLNAVQWTHQSAGSDATIQFSYNGGVDFFTIGGPGVGLNDFGFAYTPTNPTIRGMAKIIADDPSPFTNMYDESDAWFTIAGIEVVRPALGVTYTIGTGNTIRWISAGSEDPFGQARIYYTTAAGASNLIATVGNNQAYPGLNNYTWNMGPDIEPSPAAHVIVQSGAYSGRSPEFILRGMKFTTPAAGQVFDVGANVSVTWKQAGLDSSSVGYFYLSTDGGTTFSTNPINAALNWSVIAEAYPWSVDPDTDPTTNAVLKFEITSSATNTDIGFVAYSEPFVLRGLKVKVPDSGTSWSHGQTNDIEFLAAQAGSFATIEYSLDGGSTFDTARPIATSFAIQDGLNTYSWPIEAFRTPSTNGRVRVSTSVASDQSESFTLNGVKVLRPVSTDIWAVDETNRIQWVAVGTVGSYDLAYRKDGGPWPPIASGVGGTEYPWTVPLAAVSSNVEIRVRDSGGFEGISELFRIVGEPTIDILSPAPGALWAVSRTYNIAWSKGGKMTNDFHVMYSSAPYTATNDIFVGEVTYNITNNTYSVPWSIPDRIGPTKIIVRNNLRPEVSDVSEEFYIVGLFTVLYPNGGETNIYALKPTTVSWFTRGSVSEVNLFYSSDPVHGAASWQQINTTPIPNNGGGLGDELTTYSWTIPDMESDTVRFRVEQADRPGANDDSDADFSIRYFQIIWNVYDAATTNALDKLSVNDSSGWAASSLTAPVLRKYPYGTFDTVWSRQFFYNAVIFNWSSEPSRTINVPMQQSQEEPEYVVYGDSYYESNLDRLIIHAWLQRGGETLTEPDQCKVFIYDEAGSLVHTLTATTPPPQGVFRFEWNNVTATLDPDQTYFMRIEIVFSGITYSSIVTYTIRMPASAEQANEIQEAVELVSSNLNEFAEAQRQFREATGAALGRVTNDTSEILEDTGEIKTNVVAIRSDVEDVVIPNIATLTGEVVGVIGPAVTNIQSDLDDFSEEMDRRTARILTRPLTFEWGSTNRVLYKSRVGFGPTVSITVSNTDSGATFYSGTMQEVVGGIYQAELVATWPTNTYVVTCRDPDPGVGVDSMLVTLVGNAPSSLPILLAAMSNNLYRVESNTVSILALVEEGTNTTRLLQNISNDLARLELNITGSLARVEGLTNLTSQLDFVTNSLVALNGMTNQMAYLSNTVASISSVTNINDQLLGMSNLLFRLSSLTNMPAQMTDLTNLVASFGVVTNFGAQLAHVTNVIDNISAVTNIKDDVAAMTNAIGELAFLTNMPAQMSYITNVIDDISAVTNIREDVAAMTNAIGKIAFLTNMPAQMSYITNVIDDISAVTNIKEDVAAMTNAIGKLAFLTNLPDQMSFVTNSVAGLQQVTNVIGQMQYVTNAVGQLMPLTNLPAQMSYVTNVIDDISAITNIKEDVAAMTNAIGKLAFLTNLPAQMSYVTNVIDDISSVTNIKEDVAAMTNAIGKIAFLTNMPGQMSYITNVIDDISAVTNIKEDVAAMTNAIGKLAFLTNLPDQMSFVTNVIGDIRSLTNLSPQMSFMTNEMAGVSQGLLGLSTQVTALSNRFAGVDFEVLNGNVELLTNWLYGIDFDALAGNVALVRTNVDLLTNWLAGVSFEGMAAGIDAVSNQLYGVDFQAMQASLNTVTDQLGGVDFATMANEIQQLATDLGGVDWAALEQMANDVAGVDFSTMQDNLDQVLTLMANTDMSELAADVASIIQTLEDADLPGIATSVSALSGEIATLQAMLQSIEQASVFTVDAQAIERIEAQLGTASSIEENTLFGNLAGLERQLNSIGDTAAGAEQSASTARSQATRAATEIQGLKSAIEEGDIAGIKSRLAEIRQALGKTGEQVDEIPQLLKLLNLYDDLKEMAGSMDRFAKSKGFEKLLTFEGLGGAGEGGGEGEGEGVGRDSLLQLNQNIELMKGTMEHLKKLVDKEVYEPVVTEIYLPGAD